MRPLVLLEHLPVSSSLLFKMVDPLLQALVCRFKRTDLFLVQILQLLLQFLVFIRDFAVGLFNALGILVHFKYFILKLLYLILQLSNIFPTFHFLFKLQFLVLSGSQLVLQLNLHS